MIRKPLILFALALLILMFSGLSRAETHSWTSNPFYTKKKGFIHPSLDLDWVDSYDKPQALASVEFREVGWDNIIAGCSATATLACGTERDCTVVLYGSGGASHVSDYRCEIYPGIYWP